MAYTHKKIHIKLSVDNETNHLHPIIDSMITASTTVSSTPAIKPPTTPPPTCAVVAEDDED